MAAGIGLPIVDYQLAVKNQTQLMSQFQKSPSYASSVAYYQANIGKVTSVDDLLNNRQLLTVALSAFQLEDFIGQTGIIRQLLTQDPTQSTSLAQQLVDPRFQAFAKAFSSLQSDGGAAIGSPSSVNSVLAGYQSNEYAKWVSNLDNDPTIRQALFFQQTVQDTIDVSNTAKLYTQFQQTQSVQQAVTDYKTAIANVTSVNGLLNNPNALDFALKAFNIDPATVTTATLQRILTEPATAPATTPNVASQATDPLLTSDARFQKFAETFSTLTSDGGTTVQSSSIVNIIVGDYQTNEFAKTLAAGDPTTVGQLGSGASDTVASLLSDYQSSSGIATSISDYQNGITGVGSVGDFVNNPQLLDVALGAFNIDPTTISTAVVTQLLTNDPNGAPDVQATATALLQNDPNVANFVKTFGALGGNSGNDFSKIGTLFQQFQQQSSVQTAVNAYQNGIGQVTSVAALVGNPALLNVALDAFNIDPATASTSAITHLLTESPAQQAADPTVTTDPRYAQFVQAFGSLNTDHGVELQSSSSVSAIVTAYQTNLFAQNLATNDPTKANPIYADGSGSINALLADFTGGSGVSSAIAYYQTHIPSISTVPGLLANPQLLGVALGAFGIDPNSVTTAVVSQLLTPDANASPTVAAQASALSASNPNVAKFVAAFSSLNTDNGLATSAPSSIAAVTSAYQANQFQASVAARAQEVVANPSLAATTSLPLSDARSIATITSAFAANQFQQSLATKAQQVTAQPSAAQISAVQLLGNPTLQAVTFGALGLPAQTGALDVPQQEDALTRAGFDPSQLTDPAFLAQFINRFLANAGANAGITGTGADASALAVLQQSGATQSSDPIPIDLSVLLDSNSSSSSGGSTDLASKLVDLFA